MADQELRVSITADTSSLQAGMQQATAAVQQTSQVIQSSASATRSLAEAQTACERATRNLGQAQRELGAAAEAGNAAAAAIIEQYVEEVVQAGAAVDELTEALKNQAPVMTQAAAATSANAAATQVLGVSSRQAATAGIGILEGRMMSGNRAAAAFLSTTLGLGPVLQAAFPIIGALALGEVLLDIGKAAYDAYEKFISLDAVSEKLNDTILKMQGADVVNVHSIETANARMQELNSQTSTLLGSAQKIHDLGMMDALQGLATGNIGKLAGGVAGLFAAHGLAGSSAEDSLKEVKISEEQVALEHQLREAKIEAAHAGDAALTPEQKITAELQKQLALHAEEQRFTIERERAMGNTVPADSGGALRSAQDAGSRAQAVAEEAQIERQVRAAALSEMLADDRTAMEAMKRENTELEENMNTTWEQAARAADKSLEEQRRAQEQATEEWKKQHAEQIAMMHQATEETIKAANDQFQATERQIKFEQQLGEISARVAAQQLQAAEALKAATIQGALGKDQSLFNPAYGAKELQEYTQDQNKMTDEARKAAIEREQISQQETERVVSQFKKVFNTINSDFTRAIDEWQKGTLKGSQAFAQMFGSIVTSLENFVIKWLLEQAEMWAMNKILQATGLATQKGQQGTANVATVTGDAGVAAANTMAYYTAINPIIAPAMAAAAMAQTLSYVSLAAFEAGGIVSGASGMPVPIVAHAGERVLSAGQTQNFESMVNNSNRGGNTINAHYHAAPGETEGTQGQDLGRMLRGMLRPEAFA